MKIRTQDLKGEALNYAATLADKGNVFLITDHAGALHTCYRHDQHGSIVYTNYLNWSDAGPIIERESIELGRWADQWQATMYMEEDSLYEHGSTPLVAAMRCFVASRIGDEVEIPEELCK